MTQPPAWTPFDADSPPSLPAGRGHVVAVLVPTDAEAWAPELATRLARAWSEAGHRVVLADLDLAAPRLHDVLGVENRDGVADAVAFGASVGRVAQAVPGAPFFFIGAGTAVAEPASLLDHPRWAALCQGFQEADATLVTFVPDEGAARAAVLEQATHVVLLAPDASGPAAPDGVEAGRVLAVLGPDETPAAAPDSEPGGPEEAPVTDEPVTEEPDDEEPVDIGALAPDGDPGDGDDAPAADEAALGVAGAAGVAVTGSALEGDVAGDGDVLDIGALAPDEDALDEEAPHEAALDDGARDGSDASDGEAPLLEWEEPEDPFAGETDTPPGALAGASAVEPDGEEPEPDFALPLDDEAEAEPPFALEAGSPAEPEDDFALEPDEEPEPRAPFILEPEDEAEAEDAFALEPEEEPEDDFALQAGEEPEDDFALEPEEEPEPEFALEPEPEPEPIGEPTATPEPELVDEPLPEAEPDHPPVPLADEILAEAGDAPEPALQAGEVSEGGAPPSSGGARSFLVWLLVGLLVAVGALWWFGYVEIPGLPSPNVVTSAEPVDRSGDLNAAEPRTETSPAAAWAVAVEAHQDRQTAWDRVSELSSERPDRLWITAPVAVDGTLYHRVLVGTAPDSAAAESLRTQVADELGVEPASLVLRSTPLAFRLGETRTLEAARRRAEALRELDVPAYVLAVTYSDGEERFRVYGGAFARGQEAQALDSLLAEVGMPREELVERTGRRPE